MAYVSMAVACWTPVRGIGLGRVRCFSYTPSEPREGELRKPNEAYKGLLVAIGLCKGLLDRRGSPSVGSSGLYELLQLNFEAEITTNLILKWS